MNLFELDDRVTAAAVAATGTIIGAVIQLRAAWRREVSERARGAPVTKKSRRGPVLAVFLLVVSAGVGGFAFSQYLLMRHSDRESAAVRAELQQQVAQISATATRLEQASLRDHGPAARTDVDRAGTESVTMTTTVGPCRTRGAAPAGAAPACSEQEAVQVTLCASVPLSTVVNDLVLYARPADSARPWAESRATPGQDVGQARFSDKPFERGESDQTKQVCTAFSAWDGEHATSARLVVNYTASPAGASPAGGLRSASAASPANGVSNASTASPASGLSNASAAPAAAHEMAHAAAVISEQVP